MFEKDAKEYADGIYHYKINVSDYGEDGKINYRYSDIKEAHQKGAEVGYNKANEWHYVKDGDLPNKGVLCTVLLVNNDLIFARLREDNVWTTNGHNAFENVIAWKEIVLPELPKESE